MERLPKIARCKGDLMTCPKCHQKHLISERIFAEEWIIDVKCPICGWHACPKDNYDLSVINRMIYSVNHKVKRRSTIY